MKGAHLRRKALDRTLRLGPANSWAALVVAAVVLAAAHPPPPEGGRAEPILEALPTTTRAALLDEKLVLLGNTEGADFFRGVQALVLFEKPPERVYRLLSQTARQQEYRPDLLGIDTLERLPDGSVDEHRMRILFRNVVYRLRYRLDPAAQRITWSLARNYEHDLREIEGFWQLHPLGEGETLARFGTRVDIGPAFPTFLQEFVNRRNLPQVIERTRRWVDSDGTDRP
jgi:hypothetical protein